MRGGHIAFWDQANDRANAMLAHILRRRCGDIGLHHLTYFFSQCHAGQSSRNIGLGPDINRCIA